MAKCIIAILATLLTGCITTSAVQINKGTYVNGPKSNNDPRVIGVGVSAIIVIGMTKHKKK
jgi:hypothetical protein